MYPQIPGRHPDTPKVLLSLLASMALNKRLRQGGMGQPPGQTVRMSTPGHLRNPDNFNRNPAGQNRMADLAQMSLQMGKRRPRPPMMY